MRNPSGTHHGLVPSSWVRLFGSKAAVEPSTSDGLTVEGIIANQWTILDESESNRKSHAAAIAQSIRVIKSGYGSQHRNKASAMVVLQSRLNHLEMAHQVQMNAQHTQSLTEISWGNQIRSHVLRPYRMVKDLRTNYEVSDPDSVLEGIWMVLS